MGTINRLCVPLFEVATFDDIERLGVNEAIHRVETQLAELC